ncbi:MULTISPECIES: DUF4247 domain-containing protein [Streptomyces]|uniref:DUF4247 domain-containing protein n=2 Tax=Streptomyces TaxID=1883 RepID=A0A124ECV3_9ACTN|nr:MULTISPECIES: DUF4247 domain-containing protein [Streptomyces]KUH38826.1 hypothetical protein ATE80_10375 [Streptomyces kanasensis]UUS29670.1 DUF4247 domain-containing protein [Streptomyces changanensis]
MRTARRVCALLLVAAALGGCGGDPDRDDDGNSVPSAWISRQYRALGADRLDPRDAPAAVAREIDGHAGATSRFDSGDRVFLRYRDDIVAISPHRTGSRIEVTDYRTGYRRWKSHLRSVWPDPDGAGFRGGGPGAGK